MADMTRTTATLVSRINGERVRVYATTNHPSSSYGIPVWVDDEGTAYCQVGFETWYDIIDIIKTNNERERRNNQD